jgi:hypothetical protein
MKTQKSLTSAQAANDTCNRQVPAPTTRTVPEPTTTRTVSKPTTRIVPHPTTQPDTVPPTDELVTLTRLLTYRQHETPALTSASFRKFVDEWLSDQTDPKTVRAWKQP